MRIKPFVVLVCALVVMSAVAVLPQQRQGQPQPAPTYHPEWSPVAFDQVPPPPGFWRWRNIGVKEL